MNNQLTTVNAIFIYEGFYSVNALTSSSQKCVIIGNLQCFRNVLLLFQPAAFCISLIESPILLALLVDALRTECVVNTVMSIPVIARKSFIHIAMDCEFTGLNGQAYDKINSCGFPSRFSLTRSDLFLYSCKQSMIHNLEFCG